MRVHTYTIRPALPKRLLPLLTIAQNVCWTWMPEAIALFKRIDLDLWNATTHSPSRMLSEISQARLVELERDESFLSHMEEVALALEDYLQRPTWFSQNKRDKLQKNMTIAYFSAEYGLHESLPVYSGGLGILSGDHLKSASDLGLPFVAVGLLYRQGYFTQYLNADGWQQEAYPDNDFADLPIALVKEANGAPIRISLEMPQRPLLAQVWLLTVGRVKLYLLDTDLPENSPEDRLITAQLYGGDELMRIKQEILLGIGGLRALRAIGITPSVYHMNEGHSAFLAIERLRHLVQEHKLSLAQATEVVTASNVFTTHTPVPAGNDAFTPDLTDHYLKPYYQACGFSREQFLGLGRQNPFDHHEAFCMTVLALRLSAHRNGVSKLHGQVSRHMWEKIWPGLPAGEIPIDHITNGVHTTFWAGPDMTLLFNRYLDPRWKTNPEDGRIWEGVERIPDTELWRGHVRRRERLVAFSRERVSEQMSARGALPSEIEKAREILDPEALTLGFARRFATYKRGAMLFTDPERLSKILNNPQRPVQIIFAGKAHPRDNLGKDVIKQIVHMAREPEFRNRVLFLENYDINVAAHLVSGVDVWINNPRRPLEASGTSGMKAAVNGAINLSVLDGWWVEAYNGENGWAIGQGEEYSDLAYQDKVESLALYDILEKELIPLFYQRGKDGIPRGWTALMKRSLKTIPRVYNTNRMVIEYLENFYIQASETRWSLIEGDYAKARELAQFKSDLRHRWSQVKIENVEFKHEGEPKVGELLPLEVRLNIPGFDPKEVAVEVYQGRLNAAGEIMDGRPLPLRNVRELGDGRFLFFDEVPLAHAGRRGFAVRVLPRHPLLYQRFEPGLIVWG